MRARACVCVRPLRGAPAQSSPNLPPSGWKQVCSRERGRWQRQGCGGAARAPWELVVGGAVQVLWLAGVATVGDGDRDAARRSAAVAAASHCVGGWWWCVRRWLRVAAWVVGGGVCGGGCGSRRRRRSRWRSRRRPAAATAAAATATAAATTTSATASPNFPPYAVDALELHRWPPPPGHAAGAAIASPQLRTLVTLCQVVTL